MIKRKVLALLLTVCVLAGLAAGFSSHAADYDGQVDIALLVEYGKQMYSAHEGNYNTVVTNDSGAVGMGILGWRGYSALKLLKMICEADPELSLQTLGDALYNEVVSTPLVWPNWDNRRFTSEEAARTKILLGTQVGIDCENELARQDITRQVGEAWGQGVRTDAALLYYCSVSNHYGPGGAQKFMTYVRKALGIEKGDLITSLDEFHEAVKKAAQSESYVAGTLAYRTKIYNYIKNVLCLDTTGQTPSTPPQPEPVPVCENCPSAQFTDVPPKGNWAHDGIDYVISHGLFNGTSATTFSPNDNMTRAMLVTVLYRMEGTPETDGELLFDDVAENAYYTDAVCWAAQNDIVRGVGERQFNPDGVITREQMATILYRYSQTKGMSCEADPVLLDGYGDSMDVSAFAREALCWAVSCDLIRGDTSSGYLTLNPGGSATRAQVATILMRYLTD